MSHWQSCKEGNARVSAPDRVQDESQAGAQTGVEGQSWDRTGSQNAPPAPTRATTKARARARAKAKAEASARAQSEPDSRWRRLTVAKRWVAVAGVLCFLDVAVVGIFFERIFRDLPVMSANLCAHQVAGLVRHGADMSDVRDLVATWKRICPDILVALVVDASGRIVVSSEASLENSNVASKCLIDVKALRVWLSQNAPDTGVRADRIYHIAAEEARSAVDGRSCKVWVVCPPAMYTSWIGRAAMITYAPNAEWALWSLIWWLAVPTWMYLDRVVATRKADRSAVLWALAGLVGNGLALLVYLTVCRRRRRTFAGRADTAERGSTINSPRLMGP